MTDRTRSLAADRRVEHHRIRVGFLIAAAFVLSLVFLSSSARAADSTPTIVLVHGAFASPAGWEGVSFAAASHVGGLTHYSARFVKLIEQAASATAN